MKLKLLGLLLAFAGVLYWQDSTSDDAMDKYIEEYKQFQAKADSVTELADSLKVEITIADNESRAAESRAKVLGSQVNSLKNETLSMEERAEVMKETLLDTLELARMFGFKLPSRKASFAVGLAMGLGAGILVIK